MFLAHRRPAVYTTTRWSFSHYKAHTVANLLDDLTERGFINHVTNPVVLRRALDSRRQVVYTGIDPTAQSLHIGHLIPLMCLLHFQLRGHTIIPLIGGATGRLGDPSGRHLERKPAVPKQVEDNVAHLTKNLLDFFHCAFIYGNTRMGSQGELSDRPVVINNLQWHQHFNMLDFVQHVGIHARVNTMLNRESVRARLESGQGMSFTEFTYQLLQAYDFYHLHNHFGCTIQVGGSDQWGNILAGLELIDRLGRYSFATTTKDTPLKAFGITTPLLTTSSGEKFGKSAGNAVWLNPNLTSVFDFYQFFVRVDDADVEKYLKLFTLLSSSVIRSIMEAHTGQPEKRLAQQRLAAEVTEMVHASGGLARAQTLTNLLFESDYTGLTANQIISAFEDDARLVLINEHELMDTPVMKLAVRYHLVSSGAVSRALIQGRGLYINNKAVPEPQYKLTKPDLINDRVAILRAGKDKVLVLATNPP